MRKPTADDYIEPINRAQDYISAHLDGNLRLESLARVAAFSPWHFHRPFQALTGEPVAACIQRMRIEKAVYSLVHQPRSPRRDCRRPRRPRR
jgi:AraC family transcriptional regulator